MNFANLYWIYVGVLAFTVVCSVLLAGWLWLSGRRAVGLDILGLFCLGTGTWHMGQLLVATGLPDWARLGQALLNLSYLNPALFLHFSLRIAHGKTGELPNRHRQLLTLGYISAGLLSIVAVATEAGRLEPWLGFKLFYKVEGMLWPMAAFSLLITAVAFWFLWQARRQAETRRRQQITWVLATYLWGLFTASSFVIASLSIEQFPYSMLLLPTYNIALVYGITRYELMSVNRWAVGVLAAVILALVALAAGAFLLTLLTQAGFEAFAALPIWQLWTILLICLLLTSLMQTPAKRFVEQLIFPGAELTPKQLARWRSILESASSWEQLQTLAEKTLLADLKMAVSIDFEGSQTDDKPTLQVIHHNGKQTVEQRNWDGATPGILRIGEAFGQVLAAAAERLQQSLQLAEKREQQQQQRHLTELGGLAASVAHELRNPLNIIAMANAQLAPSSPADESRVSENVSEHITEQLGRAERLIADLLSYAGNIDIQAQPVLLRPLLMAELARLNSGQQSIHTEADIDEAIQLHADPQRLQQILHNLLSNAAAMLRANTDAKIRVTAAINTAQQCTIRIFDNGPGVPAELRDTLFQPFSSGRRDGTGLGLAIAQRLAEAQGGGIQLLQPEADSGWSTAFELTLPCTGATP